MKLKNWRIRKYLKEFINSKDLANSNNWTNLINSKTQYFNIIVLQIL